MDSSTLLLEEVQSSLAVALARIEGLKHRERLLLRENQLLRSQLKEAGIPEQPTPPDLPLAEPAAQALVRVASVSQPGQQPQLTHKYPPLFFHTPDGKVPGTILASQDSLQFVQLKARVTPAEFLGVREVHDVPLQHLAVGQQVGLSVPDITKMLTGTATCSMAALMHSSLGGEYRAPAAAPYPRTAPVAASSALRAGCCSA